MKKALLFTLLSLFALISYGQEITIDVTKPGTLSSLIVFITIEQPKLIRNIRV